MFYCLQTFLFVLLTEQKEKLSEVEQQLKKAEVAQRRRMQTEKAARESEVCSCFFLFFWYLCSEHCKEFSLFGRSFILLFDPLH